MYGWLHVAAIVTVVSETDIFVSPTDNFNIINPYQLFGVGALAPRGLPPFIGGLCGDHSPHRTTMTQTKRCPIFKFGSWWCRLFDMFAASDVETSESSIGLDLSSKLLFGTIRRLALLLPKLSSESGAPARARLLKRRRTLATLPRSRVSSKARLLLLT